LLSPDGGACDDSVWAGFRLVGDLMGVFKADDTTLGLSNLGFHYHLEHAPQRTPPLNWATKVKSFQKSLPQPPSSTIATASTNKFLAALNASSTALHAAKNSAAAVTFDEDDENEDDDDEEEDGLF
jgi:hypothetical protein